jgi:hypothetical protein
MVKKNNINLTSVNILSEIYVRFKKNTVDSDMNLQKLVNRCVDLYCKDKQFQETVDDHKTLSNKNSKF